MSLLYVALGGAAGSVARYLAAERLASWSDSGAAAIFLVNVAGSFAIGLFLTLGEEHDLWSADVRLLVATGFLGGFTTFSTLTWQTHELLRVRDFAGATLNLAGSALAGMVAVYAGILTARAGS